MDRALSRPPDDPGAGKTIMAGLLLKELALRGAVMRTLIARAMGKLMEYEQKAAGGADMALSIQEERRHLDDLRRRKETRLAQTERAAVLILNEWLKAEQLGDAYWLYVVTNALEAPELSGGQALHLIRNPGHRLPREEVVPRVGYRVSCEGWDSVAE